MTTSLFDRVTVQHHLVVTPQVHASCIAVGDADEAELVDAGDDAREHAALCAVMLLLVVDDLMKVNDFL